MAKYVFSAFADEAGKSIEEQIAALVRNDIGCIEVRMIDGKNILTFSEEELHAIRAKFDAAGIKVSSIGSPIGKYDIHADFEPHLEEFRYCMKVAKILGAPRIRIFSFYVKQDELAACRDEVIRRLSVMLEEAKAEGLTLCHENEALIYGQMPAEVKDVLTSLPEMRGIFDAANYIMNDGDVKEGFRVTLPSLEYIHIKDASYAEKIILPAGEGDGCLADVLTETDSARDGVVYLTLEPHLRLFDGFISIDKHTLKGKYTFANSTESFDCAVSSLEKVLTSIGFKKGDNREWKK